MKKLSTFLLILNPISGFGIVATIFGALPWWAIFLLIAQVYLNLSFFFYTHKADFQAYEAEMVEWKKGYDYVGNDVMYGTEFWRNKTTGEIIEI